MQFFLFNDTAATEIYTLSLHDALPIWVRGQGDDTRPHERTDARSTWRSEEDRMVARTMTEAERWLERHHDERFFLRSEEHTSELQSRQYLVCRLLLENKHSHAPPSPFY